MSQPRILDKFRIDELSGVDRPAQTGARAVLMKRDFSDKERQAMADRGEALPDGSFPIANISDLENAIHAIGRAKDPAKAKAHIIARAKTLGATTKLPDGWTVSKNDPTNMEDAMSAELKKALGLADTATEAEALAAITKAMTTASQVADLNKSISILKAKADMSDAEKAHMKTLSDNDADDFATKSKADRAKVMEKAASGDETYTTAEGTTISKRALGDATFTLLKSQDTTLRKMQGELAIEKAAREDAVFTKRASEELSHLSGAIEKKTALLKAVSAMPEDLRTFTTDLLKAADAKAKLAFEKRGVGGSYDDNADDPGAKLDKMAKQHAADNKTDYHSAYDAVCKTEDGQRLYKAYRDGKPAVAA